MKKKLVSLLSLILAVVMICPTMVFADGEETTPAITVSGDGLFYPSTTKSTATLSITGATPKSVKWTVLDDKVLSIDNETSKTPKITALKAGTTQISAMYTYAVEGQDDATNTVSTSVTVTANTVKSAVLGSKTTIDYVVGQKISKDNIEVIATYADGSTGTIADFTYTPNANTALKTTHNQLSVQVPGLSEPLTQTINVADVSVTDLITGIKITSPTKDEVFEVGSQLQKANIKVELTYVGGSKGTTDPVETSGIVVEGLTFTSGAYTFSSNDASEGKKTITVKYVGHTASVDITVKPKETETEKNETNDPTVNYTYVANVTTPPTKTTYKVGETFDPAGMVVSLCRVNGNISETLIAGMAVSNLTGLSAFTSSDISDNKSISFNISYNISGIGLKSYSCTVTGLKVVSNTDSRDLSSISTVYMKASTYPEGYDFSLADIEKIKVKFEDGDTATINYEEFDKYAFTSTLSLEVLTSGGSRKTSSSNKNYKYTIQSSDIKEESDGDQYVTLALYYDYVKSNGSTAETSKTVTVYVGETDIAYYYDDDLIYNYENLEDALEYTIDDDDDWENFELDDVDDDEEITLKLGKDYKIDSSFDKFSPRHNVIIDLNGHDLRFYSDTIVVDKDDDDYTVTITNSSKTEADFTYYDKDITITLGEDDKFEFEYSTDDDYLPGIVTVTAAAGTGGKITASPSLSSSGTVKVGMGSDVKFTITPEKDYSVDAVKVNTKAVSTTNNDNYSVSSTGVVTYTLKDVDINTKVEVTFKENKKAWNNPFTDVRETASYYSAVEFVYTNELFKGTTDTKFAPDTTMTRAMFVTVLGRLADVDVSKYKTSSFTDIPLNSSTSWYAPYVQWAVDYGIVQGYGDGTFGPNNEITHQQMYVMMYRYSMFVENNQTNVRNVILNMSDRNDIADWATDAVKYAQQNDFLVLSGSRVDPTGDALRWELATLLESFCETVLKWAK